MAPAHGSSVSGGEIQLGWTLVVTITGPAAKRALLFRHFEQPCLYQLNSCPSENLSPMHKPMGKAPGKLSAQVEALHALLFSGTVLPTFRQKTSLWCQKLVKQGLMSTSQQLLDSHLQVIWTGKKLRCKLNSTDTVSHFSKFSCISFPFEVPSLLMLHPQTKEGAKTRKDKCIT